MKQFFILLFFALSNFAYSQNLKKTEVKEVANKAIIEILTHFESHTSLIGKKLTIGIFKIGNGSGSANVAGDDEISETYFFTVTGSPGDEKPEFKVFSLGPFYASKIVKTTDLGDKYVLTLEHYNAGKRQIHKLIISLDKITY